MTDSSSGFTTVSILFIARMAGTLAARSCFISSVSCGPREAMGSTTSTTASTSATLSRTTLSIYSPRRVRARWKPGVSMRTSWASPRFMMAVMRLRVVWGLFETMATFSPTRAFVSVLLPTLGRPAMVIIAFLSIAAPRFCLPSRQLPARDEDYRCKPDADESHGHRRAHRLVVEDDAAEKLQGRIYVHEYARKRH